MSLTTSPDVPLLITVPSHTPSASPLVSSERRITLGWPLSTLKAKLEPITGIPSASQILRAKGLDGSWTPISAGGRDEDSVTVGDANALWREGIRRGGEIEVLDSRPASARTNYTDPSLSSVEKYTMPESQYATLDDSVLAWKKRQGLGRFDPNAKSAEDLALERYQRDGHEIHSRKIFLGKRARVAKDDGRRGEVKFLGEVDGLGGERERGCVWVGVELDEPVGRNDGSVEVEGKDGKERKKLWESKGEKFGVLVRPEKVEAGDEWTVLDDLGEDLEEI